MFWPVQFSLPLCQVIIWVLANIQIGDLSLLSHCAAFLNPFAKLLGLDGYILMAFILGFPANEIVVPIIIMSYMATGSMVELDNLSELRTLLVSNGWTWLTAICTMLFSLMHWPCGTTPDNPERIRQFKMDGSFISYPDTIRCSYLLYSCQYSTFIRVGLN